jgi:hypothetical protein
MRLRPWGDFRGCADLVTARFTSTGRCRHLRIEATLTP